MDHLEWMLTELENWQADKMGRKRALVVIIGLLFTKLVLGHGATQLMVVFGGLMLLAQWRRRQRLQKELDKTLARGQALDQKVREAKRPVVLNPSLKAAHKEEFWYDDRPGSDKKAHMRQRSGRLFQGNKRKAADGGSGGSGGGTWKMVEGEVQGNIEDVD